MYEFIVNIVNEFDVQFMIIFCVYLVYFFFNLKMMLNFKKKSFFIKKRIKLRGLNE